MLQVSDETTNSALVIDWVPIQRTALVRWQQNKPRVGSTSRIRQGIADWWSMSLIDHEVAARLPCNVYDLGAEQPSSPGVAGRFPNYWDFLKSEARDFLRGNWPVAATLIRLKLSPESLAFVPASGRLLVGAPEWAWNPTSAAPVEPPAWFTEES